LEEINQNPGSANWSNSSPQVELPNATAALVLGIISLVCTVLLWCCYGFIPGLIMAIIGLALGVSSIKSYNSNPALYTEKSFKNAKAGKIMSLISLILCAVMIVLAILLIALGIALDAREYMK
jgi:F0F1-type ATP synthase assembly protein I